MEKALCGVCGEPMPEGEEMFNYHGYSGPCPAPPKPRADDPHEIADLTLGELARLVGVLERARTILGNMAQENEGAIFNRWPISHEPLRADAKGLLPEIDDVLRTHQ